MLLGTHNPFLPIVEAVVTVIGLVLIAVGTGWMTFLVLIGSTREQPTFERDSIPARPTTATSPVPRRDRLLKAMEELQDSALDLIERRRELHHMNMRQWHNEHREETDGEIEATKRYRLAKTNLELYRRSLPTEFWSPVDSFGEAIEESISREAYSTPNDKAVYEALNRNWHKATQGINDISFGMPTDDPVSRASVN